ncbi:MAG: hypothetical protein WDN45_12920 [Caulobacteraceae bacterium]
MEESPELYEISPDAILAWQERGQERRTRSQDGDGGRPQPRPRPARRLAGPGRAGGRRQDPHRRRLAHGGGGRDRFRTPSLRPLHARALGDGE